MQVFPADAPGTYFNVARIGLVAAKLRGEFEATRPDRIDLQFLDLALCIGPWQAARKVRGARGACVRARRLVHRLLCIMRGR